MTDDALTSKAYWTLQMEQADAFMRQILDYPVAECGDGLADLSQAAERAGVEVAFSSAPAATGTVRVFSLRTGLIEPFVAACREMNRCGFVMKVEDGYRTRPMQKALARTPAVFDAILRTVLWETNGRTPELEFLSRRVAVLVAACPNLGTHTSGSAIDISVLDANSGEPIDRGAPYLEMGPKTPMDSPFVGEEARRHRRQITDLMRRCGFVAYPYEFWHYCAGDVLDAYLSHTGRPARYGPVDWDSAANAVMPIADPTRPLNSPQEISELIRQSLQRLGRR